jgi:hypothetical protein
MQSYTVGYNYEVREKGEMCDCGHEKDSHSSPFTGDTICYGGGDCKCAMVFPSRVRVPIVGSVQQVNLNIKKPQFRPQRVDAKIIKVHGAERVFHRNYGSDVFVLCDVEVRGRKMLAYSEWVNEDV